MTPTVRPAPGDCPLRLLAVDDSPDDLDLFRDALQSASLLTPDDGSDLDSQTTVQLHTANNGAEALDALDGCEGSWHLV